MRVFLFAILGALLCGCASHDATTGLGLQSQFKEAANGRINVKSSSDPVASDGELIPRGSLEDFKFCTTIFQTPFDQFTCLKDLQNGNDPVDVPNRKM